MFRLAKLRHPAIRVVYRQPSVRSQETLVIALRTKGGRKKERGKKNTVSVDRLKEQFQVGWNFFGAQRSVGQKAHF